MKREHQESHEAGFMDLPEEIQAQIFLSMINYVIQKQKHWNKMIPLATLSKFHQSFPERFLIPGLREVSWGIVYWLPVHVLLLFRDLVTFIPFPGPKIDCNLLLQKYRDLSSLHAFHADNTIDFSMLERLTTLSCSESMCDTDLLHLTNLTKLKIPFRSGGISHITNESLSRLTNLTSLDIGTEHMFYGNARDRIKFDNKSLENLSNLRILKMRGAKCRGKIILISITYHNLFDLI